MKQGGKKFAIRLLRWLIPIGISGLAIYLVLRDIELGQFVDHLLRIRPLTYLLATLVFFAALLLRVVCWYLLLQKKVSFRDAFFTMNAGYLLNNVFPFRLGEIGRAIMLDRPEGPTAFEVLSSVIVERVFDVFLAALFVVSLLPRILSDHFDQRLITAALILAAIGLVVLYLAARFRTLVEKWLTQIGNRISFVKQWLLPKARQVLDGLAVLNKPGLFFLAFGSLTLSWMLAFLENFIIFSSLSPDPPFWWLMFVLSAGAFGAALPSAPAALGVFEGVMVAAFAVLGVPEEIALTHAVVVHMLQFVYSNTLGLIGLRLKGQAVIDLYRRAVHRKPDASQPD